MLYDFAMHTSTPDSSGTGGSIPVTHETHVIERIRRNHALEHATLHMLAQRIENLRGGGYAAPTGYYVFGNADLENIAWAANEAIRRMNEGESRLAVHPGCGTNLATTGVLTGVLSFVGANLFRKARWNERLTFAVLGAMIGGFLAYPLGPWMQANVTTSANMHGMSIKAIKRTQFMNMPAHFVETEITGFA